jgi:hypothetical protein
LVVWNVGERLYRVRIDDRVQGTGEEPKQVEWSYVPEDARQRHGLAAARIRELGGEIDGRFGRELHAPRTTGWRTVVYLSKDWRGTDGDIAFLAGLHNLSDLYLVQAKVGDDAMRHVGELRHLEALFLEETQVTNDGLAYLDALTNLTYCRLEGPAGGRHFTDEAIVHLKSLPRLSTLTLYGSGFTDYALAQLKDFPRLRELVLVDCDVTRKARDDLRRAKPALRGGSVPAQMLLHRKPHTY